MTVRKLKYLTLTIIVLTAVCVFCACRAATKSSAERALKRLLTVDFSYVGEKRSEELVEYFFIDENGVEFSYSSAYTSAGLDGATFYHYWNNSTDYVQASVDFNKDALLALCEGSGLYCEYGEYADISIHVENKYDIETAAKLVCDLANKQGTIHIKKTSDAPYSMPEMRVLYGAGSYSGTSFYFPIDGEDLPELDGVKDTITKDYAQFVRENPKYNDMTESELADIPAQSLFVTVDGIEIEGAEFYLFDDGKYYIELSNLTPSNGRYMGITAFDELCSELGIENSFSETALFWRINGSRYSTRYVEDTGMDILKDGKVICTLEVYYDYQESYLCKAAPDDFALMLDCSYDIDNVRGFINFMSKQGGAA